MCMLSAVRCQMSKQVQSSWSVQNCRSRVSFSGIALIIVVCYNNRCLSWQSIVTSRMFASAHLYARVAVTKSRRRRCNHPWLVPASNTRLAVCWDLSLFLLTFAKARFQTHEHKVSTLRASLENLHLWSFIIGFLEIMSHEILLEINFLLDWFR